LLNVFAVKDSVLFIFPNVNKIFKILIPIVTCVTTITIGIVYPNLGMFIGLVGALSGSVICYIAPAMFSIKIDGRSWNASIMICLGSILGVLGTIVAVLAFTV
jgi:hypothetical protein